MIRDPSDGSVRIAPVVQEAMDVAREFINAGLDRATADLGLPPAGADTGLPPESKKPKDIAKLERSRLWLKSYKERK